jgi:hypothetical protein
MAASTEILIGDANGQHILIRPLRRRHPDLFDAPDGNRIECELQLAVGAFRAGFTADLRSEEMLTFLDDVRGLMRTPDGTASLATMEGHLALYLTDDGNGQIRVSGEARDDAGSSNRLQFAFDVDRASLEPVVRSLESLLAAYPVLDGADASQLARD